MTDAIRIVLVEDSAADAELVHAALEQAELQVVVQRVDTPAAFVSAVRNFVPDIVLCDHALATFNAANALEVLRSHRPGVPLIVVTGSDDPQLAVECLRLGAEDVLTKSRLQYLGTAITAALASRERLSRLTPRQVQVLKYVAEGQSTPEIARRLQLSAKTVETHRTELMRRLDIHDAVHLARFAVRVGLVSADP